MIRSSCASGAWGLIGALGVLMGVAVFCSGAAYTLSRQAEHLERPAGAPGMQSHVMLALMSGGNLAAVLLGGVGVLAIRRDLRWRERNEAALRQSEHRYHALADAMPQMLWTADAAGRVDYCNEGWRRYTGLDAGAVGLRWIGVLHPDDRDAAAAAWNAAIRRGKPLCGEYRVRGAADGQYRWFLARVLPQREGPGAGVRWIASFTDLDRQHRFQEQLERGRAEAEAASRFKTQFLANMSHEIRTPMMAILGYADLMVDANQSAADRRNAVQIIRRNGDHLLHVINDILDISKIEAGEMAIERIACSPLGVISEVAALMRVRAEQKRLKFEVCVQGPIPAMIQTDPTRLRQILINLAGNAVKFTEWGGVRVTVRLAGPAKAGSNMLLIHVSDTGIGMSREEMSKLFRPFVQADSSTTRRFGGTGLGLTISKCLAKKLGGDIAVQSKAGRGTTFTLSIDTGPLDGVALVTRGALTKSQAAPVNRSAAGAARMRGHVLLAEDGPDNRQLLTYYLEQAGLEVTTAEDGRVAVEKTAASMAAGKPFSLVLMDMQMPELDGYGASSKLRARGYAGPIIALTAHAMSDDRKKCLAAGCTDYLSKPVTRETLVECVAQHLRAAAAGGKNCDVTITTAGPACDAAPR